RGFLSEAMDAGAFGFSSGLVYPPSAYAGTDELIALSRSMARRGGQYFTHMRGEAGQLLTSIDEALRISEEGGVPLQIAHLKSFGRENWPLFDRALEAVDAARRRGLPVTADVYPYAASSTFLTSLLPDWVHDGGTARLLERLADRAVRERLLRENLRADGLWQTARGTLGFDEVTIATCPDATVEGLTLQVLGERRRCTPAEAMMDLLSEHEAMVSA